VGSQLCKRESFVSWARVVLERHAKLPFHCPRRALGAFSMLFKLLALPEFNSLPHERVMALMMGTLAAHMASTGKSDAQLCEERDPLATRYCFARPQASASIAAGLDVAFNEAGCGVFESLTGPQTTSLVNLFSLCVRSSAPETLATLRDELVVATAVRKVELADQMARSNAGAGGVTRRSHSALSGAVAAAPLLEPDLATRVVAALSQVFHGWGDGNDFLAWENEALTQDACFKRRVRPVERFRMWETQVLPVIRELTQVSLGPRSRRWAPGCPSPCPAPCPTRPSRRRHSLPSAQFVPSFAKFADQIEQNLVLARDAVIDGGGQDLSCRRPLVSNQGGGESGGGAVAEMVETTGVPSITEPGCGRPESGTEVHHSIPLDADAPEASRSSATHPDLA